MVRIRFAFGVIPSRMPARSRLKRLWAICIGAAALLAGVHARADTSEPITPIPPLVPPASARDAARLKLGEALFNSKLLSGNQRISCASCHDLVHLGGSDGRPVSIGETGRPGVRRTPSVFNVGFNFVQFWDGHAATLEDQIGFVIKDKNGLASDWPTVIKRLQAEPTLLALFDSVYRAPPSAANVTDSLVAYERTLTTPDARFDRYLRGDKTAITAQELAGYRLFKQYGCAACHQGMNVGGNMYQPLGVIGPAGEYFRAHGEIPKQDYGRFNITHVDADQFVFKVPSLRNVALRAPYFNDGSVATLDEAIRLMAMYQLGRTLSTHDVELIAKFLGTLTGAFQGKPLARAEGAP